MGAEEEKTISCRVHCHRDEIMSLLSLTRRCSSYMDCDAEEQRLVAHVCQS